MRISSREPRPGYVLIVVLIVVVVLSLSAYRFTEAMMAEYTVAVRSTEAAQAKAFAMSGVHFAAAALADPTSRTELLGGNPGESTAFSGVQLGSPEDPRGGGRFTLFNVADTFGSTGEGRYQVRYGASDESAKLNINTLIQLDKAGTVLHDALMKLPNMTEDIADAIVDWVDPDDTPRAAGAESETYLGLSNPYRAKNGPLNSVDELLFVRGITPQLLFGNDRNRNGRLDTGEADGSDFSRGWSEFLTAYGREVDTDSYGVPRIDLNEEDLLTLNESLLVALGPEMASYIVMYRITGKVTTVSTATTTESGSGSSGSSGTSSSSGGSNGSSSTTVTYGTADDLAAAVEDSLANGAAAKKKLNSVLTLVNTEMTLPKPAGATASTPTLTIASPLNDPNKLKELLPVLLEMTTTRTTYEMTPRINVNTAPPEVLTALPGLAATDVEKILSVRAGLNPADAVTQTGAWLVTDAGITASTFRKLERYVTGRSSTYRVQSVGYFGQGGPFARVEAVIDTANGTPRIVYFRDLTDLGRGFELPR